MSGNFDPDYVFSHHHATPAKLADFEQLRLLREACMLACAAVSLEGRLK
jgi:hypothetical protein